MAHPLDNPVWSALSGRQQRFNSGDHQLKYFPTDVASFVGLKNWDASDLLALEERLPAGRTFSIPLSKPVIIPDCFEVLFEIPLYQMVCSSLNRQTLPNMPLQKLGKKHLQQMLDLTALTKPGPFYEHTRDFGNYFGIFEGKRLLAMTGERMKSRGFTEVSAICTQPDQMGKGYASILLQHACERIFAKGEQPFLHVRQDNPSALHVYRKFGFEVRTEIYYAIFKRKS
ncbi:MAG: GNAT family N-acetyltransferase [Chitinophagaceae bacterium BSSC1]|nr:MAG: GNAT family N-acetyltransferase [Chitinophagaceae bacterium BSSC1]